MDFTNMSGPELDQLGHGVVVFEAAAKGKGPLLLHHDTVVGGSEPRAYRWIRITLAGRHAQYERHMTIEFLAPRHRTSKYVYNLSPDGGAWYWVTQDNEVLWDSRDIFPVWSSLEEARANRENGRLYGPGPVNDAAQARWDAMVADLHRKEAE
jgi:hypothetical protein